MSRTRTPDELRAALVAHLTFSVCLDDVTPEMLPKQFRGLPYTEVASALRDAQMKRAAR